MLQLFGSDFVYVCVCVVYTQIIHLFHLFAVHNILCMVCFECESACMCDGLFVFVMDKHPHTHTQWSRGSNFPVFHVDDLGASRHASLLSLPLASPRIHMIIHIPKRRCLLHTYACNACMSAVFASSAKRLYCSWVCVSVQPGNFASNTRRN